MWVERSEDIVKHLEERVGGWVGGWVVVRALL